MQGIIAQKVPVVAFPHKFTLNLGAPDVNGHMPWEDSIDRPQQYQIKQEHIIVCTCWGLEQQRQQQAEKR